MGRKPSMFSKNYRRELKQRRIRRSLLLIGSVLLVVGVVFVGYDKGSFFGGNDFVKNDEDSKNGIISEEVVEEGRQQPESPEKNTKEIQEEENDNMIFEAKLNSDKSVIVELKDDNNKRIISNIQCPESTNGVISPTGEKGLIIDKDTQDIYVFDVSGKIKSITNEKYIATTNEVFTKELVLQYNPNYKWVEQAAFIDDTHVAYSSQLPWINEGEERYLWIVNINDNSHNGYYNIKGNDFRFGETKPDGVTILVDGRTIIVNAQGNIVS